MSNPSKMPQSIEAEQSLLGSILLEPENLVLVVDQIHADMFYLERHRIIWRAMLALYEKGISADPFALSEELQARGELLGAGGRKYLNDLVVTAGALGSLDYCIQVCFNPS